MKPMSALFMLLAGTASLIFLFARAESTFAQDREPQFKVGDRVEANLEEFKPQRGDAWRKATISKVFDGSSAGSRPQKDSIIVAVADAVASRGSSHGIEATHLAELNIPYAKSDDLAVKRMTVTQRTESGRELVRAITVIVTEARYVLYTRSVTSTGTTYAAAVDETGTIVGRWKWPNPSIELPIAIAENIVIISHVYWANALIPEKVTAAGVWSGKISYRVKIDDGGEYTLDTRHLRPSTEK